MGVGGQCHTSAAFTPGKDPVPIVQEAGWAPGPVWTGAENLAPTGIPPDLPARSKSLYRLSYPGPLVMVDSPNMYSYLCSLYSSWVSRLRGPRSLLYNGYRVFPGDKVRPQRDADHTPTSSAEVKKELSYTSTHPMGPPGPVTGFPLPFI
jgi:hypothetical protein